MNQFANFTAQSCWKLTRHLEEFINAEATKGDRGDAAAMDWAAGALKQLWSRIGEIDGEVRRATIPAPSPCCADDGEFCGRAG